MTSVLEHAMRLNSSVQCDSVAASEFSSQCPGLSRIVHPNTWERPSEAPYLFCSFVLNAAMELEELAAWTLMALES